MMISNQKNAIIDIRIRDSILTKVSTVKFLGFTLNDNLTFNDHVKNVTTKISKSVGVIRWLQWQLTAYVMCKLYFSLVYYHLTCFTGMGKIETCAHRRARKLLTDYNQKIFIFHSIYDDFALLNAFNTNTLIFHQYFKDKLSSHQPSHMHKPIYCKTN